MTTRIPLLLLPGLLTDERLFAHQVAHLADLSQPVVANLGAGDSVAALAKAALERVPSGPFALAGLSMGGYVALEIMRMAPDRVRSLALLNTNARADSAESSENRRRLIALSERDFDAVFAALLPRLVHPERLADAALTGVLRAMARAVGPEVFRRHQQAIIARPDSRPHLAAITCPTLVVAGREDAIMPLEVSQEMATGIPGARLEVIERCGHVSSLEHPETVTALLRAWIPRAPA